jgi:hypothetical protein
MELFLTAISMLAYPASILIGARLLKNRMRRAQQRDYVYRNRTDVMGRAE